ncbi:hypothetical protein GF373_11740, partial [bacterium]|nr:hypothetical protein [bacterium]
ELHARNIGCGVHYLSLHLHAYYREKYAFTAESFPHALWHSQRTISLPLSTGMTEKDCDDVIEAVLDIFNAFPR